MPFPPTLSLSVMAPMLYLRVSCSPFNRSNRKKRCSFSINFGLGTFTKGIKTLSISLFARHHHRHRRLALWQIHQFDVAALALEIEIARTPVDSCKQQSGDTETQQAHHDHDHLAARS